MTSENPAHGPAQGSGTASENTDSAGADPADAVAAAHRAARLGKTTAGAGWLLDPFRVPAPPLLVHNDPPRSDPLRRDDR